MTDTLDILLLCSSPIDLNPTLNLRHELARIEAAVRRAALPIRLQRVFPPTRHALARALTGFRPRVFHFLGHGEEDGLWFESERGAKELVRTPELCRLLAGLDSPLRLALINACWSGTTRMESVCRALTRDTSPIRAAIGHEKPVADESAVDLARHLYQALLDGHNVARARAAAVNALAEDGLPGFTEVVLEGDGGLTLTDGLAADPAGAPRGQVLDGLPARYALPSGGFFCGRAEEYGRVVDALEEDGLTALGLWGIGGMGKTALAREAAERNAWRYPAGVAFADIRDLPEGERTVAGLLRRLLAHLDPAAGDTPDPAMALAGYLHRAGAGLLLLDNLEDLPATGHPALARFAAGLPRNGSRLLVTARTRLPPLEELATARGLDLTRGLDDYNGAFFAHWVAQRQGVRFLAEEPPRLDQGRVEGRCAGLARALSGHPKMIELAVGVARRGPQALERALAGLGGPLEAQVEALLATGLALLGDEGRRVWRWLPLFPSGSAMPEALEALARWSAVRERGEEYEATDPPPAWLEAGLGQLERAGFLDFDGEQRLYTFHQTVREHAGRSGGLDGEEVGKIVWVLLLAYATYVCTYSKDYLALDRCVPNALPLMEAGWNQRAAIAALDRPLAAMAGALASYAHRRGLWLTGRQWQERATILHRATGNPLCLAHALFRQAVFDAYGGNPTPARDALRECIVLNEQCGFQKGLASALHQLAAIEMEQGNPVEARRLLQRSHAIYQAIGDQQGLASCLYQLAVIETDQGNLAEAQLFLQSSYTIFEANGDQRGLATTLLLLTVIEMKQGNPVEARRLLQRSHTIYQAIGDQQGLAYCLYQLAVIETDQGNPAEARRLLQRSLAIKESIGDQAGLAASLHGLAIIERNLGDLADARRLLQRSLDIEKAIGNAKGRASSLIILADLEAQEGYLDAARTLAVDANAELKRIGNTKEVTAIALVQTIDSLRTTHDDTSLSWILRLPPAEAVRIVDEALEEAEPSTAVRLLALRSRLAFSQRNTDLAQAYMGRAEILLEQVPDSERGQLAEWIGRLRIQLEEATKALNEPLRLYGQAAAATKTGDPKQVLALVESALTAARRVNDGYITAMCLLTIGTILLQQGHPDLAVAPLREGLETATALGDEELLDRLRTALAAATLADHPGDTP